MEQIEDWFKIKRYPHIGLPIKIQDYQWVKDYVNNPEKIRTHSFLPFIHKTILKRRYRAVKGADLRTPKGNRFRIKDRPKERPIFYASHLDSMVFSKYNSVVSAAYENYITSKPYNDSVVAYRKIPISKYQKGNKCNIDFAKSAFEFIQKNKGKNLTVIVADITSFFDFLNHKVLKRNWARVLNDVTLPPDHYNVYKALTRIKYVHSQQLYDAYDQTLLVQRGVPNSSKRKEIVKKRINSIKYLREKNVVAYCEKKDFLTKHLDLIISKNNREGIPQGSPLSATLANVYMIDFDEILYNEIEKSKGFYQRYSDDLIIICESNVEEETIALLKDTIEGELVDLSIQPRKTKIYRFENENQNFLCYGVDHLSMENIKLTPLEYLGFTYDGQRVLIKTSGFSKFYRTMKGTFNRAAAFAQHGKNPDNGLFKSRLYKRFTHKGSKRRLIYRQSKTNPKEYYKTKKYDWGNYLTYVNKANDAMKTINSNDEIKRQSRRFWSVFHKLLKHHEKRMTGNDPILHKRLKQKELT